MGRPRWKVIVELGLAIIFVAVGAFQMDRGFSLTTLSFTSQWWYFPLGLFIMVIGLRRLNERWDEL